MSDEKPDGVKDGVTHALKVQTAALMVALVTAGAFVAIPLPGTPVPIVLQNLFVVLTGVLLGVPWAFGTIAVYLVLGAVGLPIFAGATGGLAHFAGPTGGFLVGFLFAAPATSHVFRMLRPVGGVPGLTSTIVAAVVGFLLPYGFGVTWLWYITDLSLAGAFAAGTLPFLPGDLLKAILLVLLLRTLPSSLWRRFQ